MPQASIASRFAALPRAAGWLLALALLLPVSMARAADQITIWNYYNSLPYYDHDTHEGLSAALVAYLNTALAGRYELVLKTVPRARLNLILSSQQRGIVLFAPSSAFDRPEFREYEWSLPLLRDRQELVSLSERAIEYRNTTALSGLRMGGIFGHTYPALQDDIDRGAVSMYRVSTEGQIIDMLLAKRLDAGTMASSSLDYWIQLHPGAAPRLYRSNRDLGQFTRHLMFTPGQQQARSAIDQVLRQAWRDPAWQALFARYGLAPLSPDTQLAPRPGAATRQY